MISSIRAEKGTPGENAIALSWRGALMAIAIIFFLPSMQRGFEFAFMPRQPISAKLELIQDGDDVRIDYVVSALWNVRSYWIGQIRLGGSDGPVLFTKHSPERRSYAPGSPKARDWTWCGWWEDDGCLGVPAVPSQPFVLCVRYDGFGEIGRTFFDTPYDCSEPFTPTTYAEKAG